MEKRLVAVGRMVPGNTIVRVNTAGIRRNGVTMKQYGVSPAIIRSSGMLMLPRAAIRLEIKPTGNRKPSATKNHRRHR